MKKKAELLPSMDTYTGRLQPLATKTINNNEELYQVVDFLNKTLKAQSLIFGLAKNTQEGTMTISVYQA